MKKSKDLQQLIAEADHDRLSGYIEMFDRLLLYNLAAATMPPEAIGMLMEKWEQSIKTAINMESSLRTNFLESTPQGRMAKKHNQPDGEDLRLSSNQTLKTAKTILTRNFEHDEKDLDFGTS